MQTNSSTIFLSRRNARMLILAAACVVSSFAVGIRSAGEVQPFTLIEAGGPALAGDIDGNGAVDIQDAVRVLEVVQGYREASLSELRGDPNADGVLTVDDALRILSTL